MLYKFIPFKKYKGRGFFKKTKAERKNMKI